MNLKTVTKRSGHTVAYDREKIFNAIAGANVDGGSRMTDKDIDEVASQVEWDVQDRENVSVEEIQDIVEQELMKYDFYDVAKKYITYRQKHTERRAAQKHLMESYKDIFFADAVDVDLKRDNANINTDASMGIMLKLGAEGSKHFVDNYVLTDEFREADKENWIHIHDKDFSLITFNCCQIDLLKLFHGGFSTGHGFLREPNSIRAYASLACIAIQSNQNDMFGGQSINAFDYAMAEGVRKSFHKAVREEAYKALLYRFGCDSFDNEKTFRKHFDAVMDYTRCSYTESSEDPKAGESVTAIEQAMLGIEPDAEGTADAPRPLSSISDILNSGKTHIGAQPIERFAAKHGLGYDLTPEQWDRVIAVLQRRQLVPFLDMAYQGFGFGIEEDGRVVAKFVDAGLFFLLSTSYSKSFSLYGERVGSLSVIAEDAEVAKRVLSQLKIVIRTNYSNPPTTGAALVATVLADDELRASWADELGEMRERIKRMRHGLVGGLIARGIDDMGFVADQLGMFSYSGLTKAQMVALRTDHGVYGLDSGRMCVAALNSGNLDYVVDAIAAVRA